MDDGSDRSQWLSGLLANRISDQSTSAEKPSTRRPQSSKEDTKNTRDDPAFRTRQKGRPRLNTRDGNTAERRRTQIRLAQRAYRQRKETTISALQQRVKALEDAVEAMNKAFLEFNDKAITSGICDWEPSLASKLKSTMECFIEYTRRIRPDSESDEEEARENHSIYQSDSNEKQTSLTNQSRPPTLVQKPAQSQISSLPSHPSYSNQAETVTVPPRYEDQFQSIEQSAASNTQSPKIEGSQSIPSGNLETSSWSPTDLNQQYTFAGLTASPPNFVSTPKNPLPPPKSYNFHESSFARRLMRSALERAYRLLIKPSLDGDNIFRYAKCTFTWSNQERCFAMIQQALANTAQESLENWNAPLLHIGDAGLHYPRTGIDAGASPPPGWDARAPIGPHPYVQATTPVDQSLSAEQVAHLFGLDGEWFDSSDVECYLRTKGLFLNAHSSFVEISFSQPLDPTIEGSIPSLDSPAQSSINSSSSPQSPQNMDILLSNNLFPMDEHYMWGDALLGTCSSMDPVRDQSLSELKLADNEISNSQRIYAPEPFTDPHTSFNIIPPRKKFIDVDKFVDKIIDSAVCLGRGPGFRRSAVDDALEYAIQEIF